MCLELFLPVSWEDNSHIVTVRTRCALSCFSIGLTSLLGVFSFDKLVSPLINQSVKIFITEWKPVTFCRCSCNFNYKQINKTSFKFFRQLWLPANNNTRYECQTGLRIRFKYPKKPKPTHVHIKTVTKGNFNQSQAKKCWTFSVLTVTHLFLLGLFLGSVTASA